LPSRCSTIAFIDFSQDSFIFPPEKFEKGVAELARRLAEGPVRAYGRAKKLIDKGFHEPPESQMENERYFVGKSAHEAEFREGVKAFVEKRNPSFRKRGVRHG
jgi:2-(1,2-epoxy-1,2-dihydrophenyl)acetyl-CoA isomerase